MRALMVVSLIVLSLFAAQLLRIQGFDVAYQDLAQVKASYSASRVSVLNPEWNQDKVQVIDLLDCGAMLQQADQNLHEQQVKITKLERRIDLFKREDSGLRFTIACLVALALFAALVVAACIPQGSFLRNAETGSLTTDAPLMNGIGLILALAVLIGFGGAALAIALLVEDIELGLLLWAFGRFMISSTLLGWVFLAFAYVLSGKVNEKSSAAGLALGVWFLFVLVFDLVLLALGFTGIEEGLLTQQLGVHVTRGLVARKDGYETDEPGVFACGDAGRGASLVVWAIAEGRACAQEVDESLERWSRLPHPVDPDDRGLVLG